LPVIFTSPTAPAGSAAAVTGGWPAGVSVAASAWDAADFFSRRGTTENATSVVEQGDRIADSLRDENDATALVNAFTYIRALSKREPSKLGAVGFRTTRRH